MEECDLVMKGGITSGIVYPGALQELSKKYRFRNIGGTSAGAIAATFAAAAEYGRQTGATSNNAGFNGLLGISKWLGTDSNLQNLFQAEPSTRPLLKLLLALLAIKNDSKKNACCKILRLIVALASSVPFGFFGGAALGLAAGLVLFFLPWLRSDALTHWYSDPWFVFEFIPLAALITFGALLGSAVSVVVLLWRGVPKNDYGICHGHLTKPGKKPVLTDWMNDRLNELAGLKQSEVLTIGALATKEITLALVTTSLSHGRPYRLPFDERVWIFDRCDMEKYFPKSVVDHLIAKSPSSSRIKFTGKMADRFFLLPRGDDFPVLLAARMSLSFPVLISAVRLYRPHFGSLTRGEDRTIQIDSLEDLNECWFSDGGISSNFPIHFFDAWLPRRPTFGINLRGMPVRTIAEGAQARTTNANYYERFNGRVFLPKAGHRQHQPEWGPVNGIPGLIGAIGHTAQNFRDNLQAEMPGYDERIVHIRLDKDEGGLNLSMPPEIVKKIQDYGEAAGQLLVQDFQMPDHKKVRMLTLLPLLEKNLKTVQDVLKHPDYQKLLTQGGPATNPPYPVSVDWLNDAIARIQLLLKLIDDWKTLDAAWQANGHSLTNDSFFIKEAPKSDAALRVVPPF